MLFFDDFTPTETVPYTLASTFRAIRNNNSSGKIFKRKIK